MPDKKFGWQSAHVDLISASLNEYIKPDYTQLTADRPENPEETTEPKKTARDLVAIKKGIRPEIIEPEKENRA